MSKAIGLTYQKLVEYMLLQRGFVISEVLGDYSPYDLLSDWKGKLNRIQVRSTHWRKNKKNRGYKLLCGTWNRKRAFTKNDCDFIVAITGKYNSVYILPIEKINQKTIYLHPDKEEYSNSKFSTKNIMKWEIFKEAWDLLK